MRTPPTCEFCGKRQATTIVLFNIVVCSPCCINAVMFLTPKAVPARKV